MIRDRQTSVPILTLSADCVGIVNHSVLGVAQFLILTRLSQRGTCMQIQVGHKQEGPAVSVHLSYVLLNVSFIKFYSGDQIFDQLRNCQLLHKHSAPCSQFLTAVCQLFFISIVLTVTVQRLLCGFHRLIKQYKMSPITSKTLV
jgi:hypothetical protein